MGHPGFGLIGPEGPPGAQGERGPPGRILSSDGVVEIEGEKGRKVGVLLSY